MNSGKFVDKLKHYSSGVFSHYTNEFLEAKAAFPQEASGRNIIKKFGNLMAQKVRTNDRWQVQIPLFGDSLLTVLNTGVYDMLITCMLHPIYGIEDIRQKDDGYFSYPLFLPAIFQPKSDGSMPELNNCISYLHRLHSTSNPDPKRDKLNNFYQSLVERNPNFWNDFGLPENFVELKCIFPNANPGDIIIWQVYHGSGGIKTTSSTPSLTCFYDVTYRNNLSPTERKLYYKRFLAGPFQCGAGSNRHEGNNFLFRKTRGEKGGLLCGLSSEEELTPLTRYLHGDDSVSPLINPPEFLSPENLREIQEKRYCVFSVKDSVKDTVLVREWLGMIEDLKREFMEYFNWRLFGSEPEYANYSLSLENPSNPLWEIISGERKVAKEHLGDDFALYFYSSKEGRRVRSPKNGGVKLASDSGMGAAANIFDLPSQRTLRGSVIMYGIMSQLYGTPELIQVAERFRIKTAHKVLRIHVDKEFPLERILEKEPSNKRIKI